MKEPTDDEIRLHLVSLGWEDWTTLYPPDWGPGVAVLAAYRAGWRREMLPADQADDCDQEDDAEPRPRPTDPWAEIHHPDKHKPVGNQPVTEPRHMYLCECGQLHQRHPDLLVDEGKGTN